MLDVLGINARNLLYVHGLNPRRHFPLADDKIRTKAVLLSAGVGVPETLCVLSNVSEVTRARVLLADAGEFVIKPARGRRGSGILVISGTRAGRFIGPGDSSISWAALKRAMGDILFGVHSFGRDDRVLVERRIRSHAGLGALALYGLPDIRVILLHEEPVMAMMRIPTRASGGRANLHQGALGVGLRLNDGLAVRCIRNRKPIETHPDNGAPVVGYTVPMWTEVIDTARRASAALPLPYLGVDVVITDAAGPMVMEVNVRPGLEIQNVNGSGLRRVLSAVAGRRRAES